jgi:hypothetical protein
MKRGSTLFLKTVIILMALGVLALCIIVLPQGIRSELEPAADFDYGLIMIGMYVSAIPFFIALYQAFKLLNLIDKNNAFSELAVKALKNIKYCALAISALYAIGMPYIFTVADRDDAPGVVAIGLIIIGASFVIAMFAGVLQKLLQNVLDIKAENELTV